MNQSKSIPTLKMLREKREAILALAQQYGASNVRIFGSVARGDATIESDIDILVQFNEQATLLDHSGLRLDLIDILGYRVDVISDHRRLTDQFRQQIEREAVAL